MKPRTLTVSPHLFRDDLIASRCGGHSLESSHIRMACRISSDSEAPVRAFIDLRRSSRSGSMTKLTRFLTAVPTLSLAFQVGQQGEYRLWPSGQGATPKRKKLLQTQPLTRDRVESFHNAIRETILNYLWHYSYISVYLATIGPLSRGAQTREHAPPEDGPSYSDYSYVYINTS